MKRNFWIRIFALCGMLTLVVGCGDGGKSTSSTGPAAPSLDSPDAAERAAAAREAAKKYGGEP